METITKIRWNPIFKEVFLLVETIFFSSFQRFLPLFLTSFFIPASGNGFSFAQRFFLQDETVTEISRSRFLKKGHILTNVTNALTSGNHFLQFFQTTVNCCQEKIFFLQLEHIFRPNFYSG